MFGWWFYWQASMPHYPSLSSLHRAAVRPLESTAVSAQGWACSFTTGSARERGSTSAWGACRGSKISIQKIRLWKQTAPSSRVPVNPIHSKSTTMETSRKEGHNDTNSLIQSYSLFSDAFLSVNINIQPPNSFNDAQ